MLLKVLNGVFGCLFFVWGFGLGFVSFVLHVWMLPLSWSLSYWFSAVHVNVVEPVPVHVFRRNHVIRHHRLIVASKGVCHIHGDALVESGAIIFHVPRSTARGAHEELVIR